MGNNKLKYKAVFKHEFLSFKHHSCTMSYHMEILLPFRNSLFDFFLAHMDKDKR